MNCKYLRLWGAVLPGVVLAVAGPASAAEPAPSPYIADVEIDPTTLRKYADESDNFHLTWHADGALYGAYGDGWGFVRTDIPKRAIGVSRIAGTPPALSGVDVWEGGTQGGRCCWAPWNGKSWGMLAVDRDLHMWFTIGRPRALGFTEARIATSSDGGRSWRKAGWAFTPADGMLMPTFMQLGQGYTAEDLPVEITDYAYSFHTRYVAHPGHVQSPGEVLLMRAPKDRVRDRDAYQFFAGTASDGTPIWSAELEDRLPVLTKSHILDVAPSVAWNPYLQRFLMVMAHLPADDPTKRGVAFYDAAAPWGPWYRVKELDEFFEGTIFFHQLPTKWMAEDGSAWLAFTGPDKEGGQEWDALDLVKVRLVPFDTPPPVALVDGASIAAGQRVRVDVLANDTGTAIAVAAVAPADHGDVQLTTDGRVTYASPSGYSGDDSFTYTIRDQFGRTAEGSVIIEVTASD